MPSSPANSAFFLLRNPSKRCTTNFDASGYKTSPTTLSMQDSQHVFQQSFSHNHSSQYHFPHTHHFPHPLWCTTSMLRVTNARSPFKYEVRTCLAIPLIISLYNHISHYRHAYIHPSIIVKEEGFACMHACLLAQGVKKMSFLLRHVNNNVFLPKLRFCPSRNTMPHHG